MNHTEKIIAAYRHADANARIDMYLLYRDLREQFAQIDNSKMKTTQQPELQYVIKPLVKNRFVLRLQNCCRSLLTNFLNSFVAK